MIPACSDKVNPLKQREAGDDLQLESTSGSQQVSLANETGSYLSCWICSSCALLGKFLITSHFGRDDPASSQEVYICTLYNLFDQFPLKSRTITPLYSFTAATLHDSNIHRFFHHASSPSLMSSAEVSVFCIYTHEIASCTYANCKRVKQYYLFVSSPNNQK